MKRSDFLRVTGLLGGGLLVNKSAFLQNPGLPEVRTEYMNRGFHSSGLENAIARFKATVHDKNLGWIFENCISNTIDNSLKYSQQTGKSETVIISNTDGRVDVKDSTIRVFPYLNFIQDDTRMQSMIKGVINYQKMHIANSQEKPQDDMLSFTILLAYKYWKLTGDESVFDMHWKDVIIRTVTNYDKVKHFGKNMSAGNSLSMQGNCFAKHSTVVGALLRPDGEECIYPYLTGTNIFMMSSMRKAAEIAESVLHNNDLAFQLYKLASKMQTLLKKHSIVEHPRYGMVYSYEWNRSASYILMDGAALPSLLSLPYLSAIEKNDPLYVNTRNMLLSDANPYFFIGKLASGGGIPWGGQEMISTMILTIKGLTSDDDYEIKETISALQQIHCKEGLMNEFFHKDKKGEFMNKRHAQANSLFADLLWKTFIERPYLL